MEILFFISRTSYQLCVVPLGIALLSSTFFTLNYTNEIVNMEITVLIETNGTFS